MISKKAFDSLEWDFFEKNVTKTLILVQISEDGFIFSTTMFKVAYALCTFHINRGVRHFFVTESGILAIAIRNQENIKGIAKGGLETKLLQFAGHKTPALSELDSAQVLFELLERFEKT